MSHLAVRPPIARRLGAAAAVGAVSLALAGCGSSSKRGHGHEHHGRPPSAAAASADAGAPSTTADLSGVTLKVGVFPATGWDVELKAAGLSQYALPRRLRNLGQR